jgi:hypothetical protein
MFVCVCMCTCALVCVGVCVSVFYCPVDSEDKPGLGTTDVKKTQ